MRRWGLLLCGALVVLQPADILAPPSPEDSESVRAFKEFLENPPIIVRLTARIDTGSLGERFVELRCQPGGFFVKTSPTHDGLRKAERDPDGEIGGWYNGFIWAIWCNNNYAFEQVTEAVDTPCYDGNRPHPIVDPGMRAAGLVLNMGLPCMLLRSLRWNGCRAVATNEWGAAFEATLKLSADGQLAGVEVHFPGLVVPFYPQSLSNYTYSIRYEYTDKLSGWRLPTRIVSSGYYEFELEILQVSLASKPQSKWRFLPAPYLNKRNGIMLVSEFEGDRRIRQVMYSDTTHGMVKVCGLWLKKSQMRHIFLGIVCALTAGAVATAAWQFKKAARQQQRR